AGATLGEIARMEMEVDRLYWLVVRQLLLAAQNRTVAAKIGVTEPRHLLGDRVVAVSLENVADFWEELAADAARRFPAWRQPPKALARAVAPVKQRLERLVEATMTSFFAMDVGQANEALDLQASIGADITGPSRGPGARTNREAGAAEAEWVLRPGDHVAQDYGEVAAVY